MMVDWVSAPPAGGTRPLSLCRPSACPARRGVRGQAVPWQELAAGGSPSGERGVRCRWRVTSGSGHGEGVVAEPGQDVAGLPDDLAGLGQGGALAVGAFLDGGVVGVVGGGGAG